MTTDHSRPTAWDGRPPGEGWWWIDWGPTISRERVRPIYFDGEFWEANDDDGRVWMTPADVVKAEWRLLAACPLPPEALLEPGAAE